MFSVQFIKAGESGTVNGLHIVLDVNGKTKWRHSVVVDRAGELINDFYDLGPRSKNYSLFRKDNGFVIVNDDEGTHHFMNPEELIIPIISFEKETLDGEYLMKWRNEPVRMCHFPQYDEVYHADEV